MAIKMTDLLLACRIPLNLDSFKIHLATPATGEENPPLNAFFEGKFKEWQEDQTRWNFTREMVVSLIGQPSPNLWLFAGVYKILGHEKKSEKHVAYRTELLPNQEDLIGRLVIEHARAGRPSYLIGEKDGGAFYVSSLLEKKLSVAEFPGYNAVHISYATLKIIIEQKVQSWFGALSNIKGIYFICDRKTGKGYVGSATGDSGIWQRWEAYANNGHGGNKELRDILRDSGVNYHHNFQYSILEIADSHTSDEQILRRESYWKDALMTKSPFGYNAN